MDLSTLLTPTNQLWELEWAFQNDFAYIFYTLAVIFGFVLAFAVGANDSANSWGTPIGAGSISLRMAFLLGFIFETLGALFLSRFGILSICSKKSIQQFSLSVASSVQLLVKAAWSTWMCTKSTKPLNGLNIKGDPFYLLNLE